MQSEPGTPSHRAFCSVALGVALLAFGLSGCEQDRSQTGPQVAGWSLIDPSERHPIIVSQQPQSMQVHIAPASDGLTPKQRGEVLAFVDRARASDAGNSRLVIAAPGGSDNEVAAMHAVGEIRQIIGDNGFPEASIAVEAYHASGRRDAPVKVSYLRYVAEGPECGNWPTNLAHEPNNLPYFNFGCANQHNLAAMVANPADLLGPRTESGRPGERRDVVWEKYVKGDSTTAQKADDEKIKDTK
jgi:pilus assembly protein CpaD